MEDWSGRKVFAEYASFRLEPESEYYKLRLGRYHGNAGDSFTWHNGKQFTTLDRDHDVYTGRSGGVRPRGRAGKGGDRSQSPGCLVCSCPRGSAPPPPAHRPPSQSGARVGPEWHASHPGLP